MTDTYLVTGGAGFIGNHIVRALIARGERVRILDNFSTGHRENVADLPPTVDLIEGDVRSIDVCRRATNGATFVLHQAALPSVPRSLEDPHTSHEVNATGTLNILNACRESGVRRIAYASSSSVYGPDPKMPREETDRPRPISPYAVSKLAGEQYCAAFFHSFGLETVALRYFNVFGPRQRADSPYAAVLPRFVARLAAGMPVTIFGDGGQSRDFTYVRNVVDANLLALQAPAAPGNVYNIGAGRGATVRELLRLVADALGVIGSVAFEEPRQGDLRNSLASTERAATDLAYHASTPLEEGVLQTIAWWKTQLGAATASAR